MAQPAHKSLLSLPGLGALYLRSDFNLTPWRIGGTGYRSELLLQPEERPMRYESGTVNLPGIVALDAALDWFEERGIDEVAGHCDQLTSMLIDGLSSVPGISIVGPAAGGERGHVVSFSVEGVDPLIFSQALAEQHSIGSRAGLHCAPTAHRFFGTYERGGTVRFSPGWATTPEQVDYVLRAAREVARELAN
jgi:selenocysteine lyase/cysteine desulfurase